MPPPGGRFPGQNLSNPFAHIPPQQQSGLHMPQHQQHNLQQHPAFNAANPSHSLNMFSQHQTGFQGNAMSSGLPGAGMGAGAAMPGASGSTGLDGQEARMRFAHAGQLPDAGLGRGQDGAKGTHQRIREVWKSNLKQEMQLLMSLVDQYPYISMTVKNGHPSKAYIWQEDWDTEFPGVVARPIGDFTSKQSYHYQTIRCNVDILKIIQLGVTLFSVQGDPPPAHYDGSQHHYQPKAIQNYANNVTLCPCTWTFNFKFSLQDDMYNEESIQLLKKSGADFDKLATQGIDPEEFGSLLTTSGLVLDDNVNWISFHSGYDFAYLMKLLTNLPLPDDEDAYREKVQKYFPKSLDVKFLWRHAVNIVRTGEIGAQGQRILNSLGSKSGLQDLADELNCDRFGTAHSAGSDAWLTGTVFWELKKKVFDNKIPEGMNGEMWGLTNVPPPASAATQQAILQAGSQNLNGYQGMPGGMMFHGAQAGHRRGDGPSTPTSHPAGLASTPGPAQHGGMMTPGAKGAFGDYNRYGN